MSNKVPMIDDNWESETSYMLRWCEEAMHRLESLEELAACLGCLVDAAQKSGMDQHLTNRIAGIHESSWDLHTEVAPVVDDETVRTGRFSVVRNSLSQM